MRKKGSIAAIPMSPLLKRADRESPVVSKEVRVEIRKVEDAKVRMAHRAANVRMG